MGPVASPSLGYGISFFNTGSDWYCGYRGLTVKRNWNKLYGHKESFESGSSDKEDESPSGCNYPYKTRVLGSSLWIPLDSCTPDFTEGYFLGISR